MIKISVITLLIVFVADRETAAFLTSENISNIRNNLDISIV